MFGQLLRRRVKSDYQVSYFNGSSVRRVERGRRVGWYLDGKPVTEQQATAYMRSREMP